MKNINIRFLMAVLALLTASSCQKEEIRTLKATFEQYESNGKAYIDDDYYACWEDNDEVSINGTACPVTLATSSGHANSAEITIPSTLNGQNLLAFHPADKISDMSATGGTVDVESTTITFFPFAQYFISLLVKEALMIHTND